MTLSCAGEGTSSSSPPDTFLPIDGVEHDGLATTSEVLGDLSAPGDDGSSGKGDATADGMLAPGILVGGLVSDGTDPLGGVSVYVEAEWTEGGEAFTASAETNGAGRYQLTLAEAGSYRFTFDLGGYEMVTLGPLTIEEDELDIDVVLVGELVETLYLGGRVFADVEGALFPLAGVKVTCRDEAGITAAPDKTTTGDGGFVFELEPGTYQLSFATGGYLPTSSSWYTITTFGIEDLFVVLEPDPVTATYSLAGVVRDDQGPLAGVDVALFEGTDGDLVQVAPTTDGNGSFQFPAVAEGAYLLRASLAGYTSGELGPLYVDGDLVDLELVLTADIIDTFRFVVQSDIHVAQDGSVPKGFKKVTRGTVESVRPQFVFFTGDMTSGNVWSPTDIETVELYWDSFFSAIEGYIPSGIRYFPSRGNHDYYNTAQKTVYDEIWSAHDVPGITIDGSYEAYYSFDYGNSHFTVLGGNAVNLGTTQTDWLEQDLAAAQGYAHRFVFAHIPVVSEMVSDHGILTGTTSDGTDLLTVLQNGAIDAIFTGHEHVFIDHPEAAPGVRQVICGTAAGTYNYTFADGTKQELVPSMVVVDVQGSTVDIYGVRDDPAFTTTWSGQQIPEPLPRQDEPTTPLADILLVDGYQRGSLAASADLGDKALAMYEGFATAQGELTVTLADQAAIAAGLVDLAAYPTVVYLLSNDSVDDMPFSDKEQALVTAYVSGGGRLIVSGTEVGYALSYKGQGPVFYADVLEAEYVADDSQEGAVVGLQGTAFSSFAGAFDQTVAPNKYPDVIAPLADAVPLVEYQGGATAAIGWTGTGSVVYFAFAINDLDDATDRRALAEASLQFVGSLP